MRTPALFAVLLALSVVPAVPAGPAVAASADGGGSLSVEATVGGAGIDGERVVVTDDPTLVVSGSAPDRVETVAVRVDGRTWRVLSPNATEFSRSVALSLDEGRHRVSVVARTATAESEVVGTVTKDTAAPRVAFTSPTTTTPSEGAPEIATVRTPAIELAGQLSDVSGVKRVTVTHTYIYEFAGERDRHRRRHVIDDPGSAFSQPLFLGIGANRVEVRVSDQTGHVRTHTFTVQLRDREAPTVRFTSIERVDGGDRVRVAGVVTDDVKVRSVGVTRGYGNSERVLVVPTDREPDPDRRQVRFETTVPAGDRTGQVRVVATDFGGARTARSLPDEYGQPIAPDLQLDEKWTRLQDGTVRIRGLVANGEIDRVTVETATTDGERIGFATIYAGAVTRRVEVDRRLAAAANGPTVVRLRAVDATGQEHDTSLVIGERRSGTETPGSAATATSTATATATAAPDGSPVDTNSDLVTAGVAGATLSALAAALVLVFR